jgi:hypothetical protein
LGFRLLLDPIVLEYDAAEKQRWRDGDRTGCSDPYCLRLTGCKGFGEYIVGRHFTTLGFEWIHHDFDLFGTNKSGKYPISEAILRNYFGDEKLKAIRSIAKTLYPLHEPRRVAIEAPDLLIYNRGGSEVRFAECKQQDTGDKLNRRQLLGFMLIGAVLRCPIDLFVLREKGKSGSLAGLEFEYRAADQAKVAPL